MAHSWRKDKKELPAMRTNLKDHGFDFVDAGEVDTMVHNGGSIASTAPFIWSIPERNLAKRLRRVHAKTLIVWGKQHRLVPVVYVDEFASRIADMLIQLIDSTGHVPVVSR